jgi:hypothetical protein
VLKLLAQLTVCSPHSAQVSLALNPSSPNWLRNLQDVDKKADVVAEAMAALQREEAAREEALQQVATMQAALQRAQVSAQYCLLSAGCTSCCALHSSTHTCWAEPAVPALSNHPCFGIFGPAARLLRTQAWPASMAACRKSSCCRTNSACWFQSRSSPQQDTAREAEAARREAEDSAAGQAAALAATRRRADTYREENRALLANYDDWLRTLVGSRIRTPPQSVANTLGVHSCGNSMSPFLSMAHAANA